MAALSDTHAERQAGSAACCEDGAVWISHGAEGQIVCHLHTELFEK